MRGSTNLNIFTGRSLNMHSLAKSERELLGRCHAALECWFLAWPSSSSSLRVLPLRSTFYTVIWAAVGKAYRVTGQMFLHSKPRSFKISRLCNGCGLVHHLAEFLACSVIVVRSGANVVTGVNFFLLFKHPASSSVLLE